MTLHITWQLAPEGSTIDLMHEGFERAILTLVDPSRGDLAESPARTAFLSDLEFNGTHSYVADGYLLAWLANLSILERLCDGMDIVFPGHGEPAAPSVAARAA